MPVVNLDISGLGALRRVRRLRDGLVRHERRQNCAELGQLVDNKSVQIDILPAGFTLVQNLLCR